MKAVESFCEWLASRCKSRMLYRGEDEEYMQRFYIFRHGQLKRLRNYGLFLHKFLASDDQEYHNHPFKWSVSFILIGGYVEFRFWPWGHVNRRVVLPFTFNFIRADDFHRVDLREGVAWTLFLAGPRMSETDRVNDWGFLNIDTGEYTSHAKRRKGK